MNSTPRFNPHSAHLLKRAIDSGITSPTELSNLMGQTSVESLGFTRWNEDFHYRSVDRALGMVGKLKERHTRDEVATALATRDSETIANLFYDGRTDIGNRESGDGWRFHGRGVIQLTGRANYETYGRKIGVDLIENPDLAADPAVSADVAVAYWKDRLKNVDQTDIDAVTRRVNGAANGYHERVAATRRWASVLTPELVEGIQEQSITYDDLLAMKMAHPGRDTGSVHSPVSLHKGTHGEDVRELQTHLRDLGYATQPDGTFGNATRDAVMAFQRNHGLAADGIAGAMTLARASNAHRLLRSEAGLYADTAVAATPASIDRGRSVHEMFDALCQAGADRNLDALCKAGREYASTPSGEDWLKQGEMHNEQAALDALALQNQQAISQAPPPPQQSAPVMSL